MMIAIQIIMLVTATVLYPRVPYVHAEDDECTMSDRRFLTGHGRRSGTTVVVVEMRQQIQNRSGVYVTASEKGREITLLNNDFAKVRVLVKNSSPYDIANIAIRHDYSASRSGPSFIDVSSVQGAEFDRIEGIFTIDRIASGGTVELSFTVQVSDDYYQGISETSVELMDFTVLDVEKRFPQRTSYSSVERHRQNVEKVGIGGKEVSCISGVAKTPAVLLERNESTIMPDIIRDELDFQATDSTQDIDFTVTPSVSEILPLSSVTYTVRVTNPGQKILRNILVDDRFHHGEQRVERDGGALVTDVGLHWLIDELSPGTVWESKYTVRVSDGLPSGHLLTSDFRLYGSDLAGMLPQSMTRTINIRVVDHQIMPMTGVDVFHVLSVAFHIIAGIIIAFLLFWIGLLFILFENRADRTGDFS